MSMRNYVNCVFVINLTKLFEMFPKIKDTYNNLMTVYNKYFEKNIISNIQELENEYNDLPLELREAYDEFVDSVHGLTNMDIYPVYHNPDESDSGDDVKGNFWICENATIPNPDINDRIHNHVISKAHYITLRLII